MVGSETIFCVGWAHWHPIVHYTRGVQIHMKNLLQNIKMYLKYRRNNILIMFKRKCTPKHDHPALTNPCITNTNMILASYIPTDPIDHVSPVLSKTSVRSASDPQACIHGL